MMLYQNRVFVATPDVYDLTEDGGLNSVEGETPRVFVPIGTRVCGEPVTRMGVMGIYSMQKAIHDWFTTHQDIVVEDAEWLKGVPGAQPTSLNIVTVIIFETATTIYVAFLRRPEFAPLVVTVDAEIESTAESSDRDPNIAYVMQLIKPFDTAALFTDSVVVKDKQFETFSLKGTMALVPVTICGQMLLQSINCLGETPLHKWEISETDVTGINEIPMAIAKPSVISGYARFLEIPAPADMRFYN